VSSVDNTALVLTTVNGTYAPDTAPPTAPSALHTTGVTGTTVALAWTGSTDNVGVTGYNVYRDGVKIITTNAGIVAYTDSGLSQGTTHSYQVSAVDAAGNESVKSASIQATTLDTTAPTVPANVSAVALAYNQVKVSWGASTDTGGSGLAGYKIYRSGSTSSIGSVLSGTLTFTDSTAQGSTAYTYQVTAYDGAGNESAKSTGATVTTPAPPDTTPPSSPGNLNSTASTLSSITLSWNASTDNVGVTGYKLMRAGVVVATLNSSALSYTDSGLTYSTSYQYSITAFDAAGNTSAPTTVSASTLTLKTGDLNLDNSINVFDLSILLSDWGQAGTVADINHDNTVNIFDLSILISNWNK
jgi:chitinase